MRAYLRPSSFALAALALSAAVAGAQSLGELAAKEKQRQEKERQKRGGASKVITENDLGGRSGGTFSNAGTTAVEPSPAASPSPGTAPQGGGEGQAKEKTAEEVQAERENEWRQRVSQARTEVTQLSEKADRLQRSLNDLSANLYTSSRATVIQELDATKTQLAAAQQKVADLEEEGRRSRFR